jgi:iron complex outermembrane recepter protein
MNARTNDREERRRGDALASAVAQALTNTTVARRRSTPYAYAASAGAMLVVALSAMPAHKAGAQEQPAQNLEEITVTGSRILRRDFSANAPITTIDQTAFQATGTVGVETILNQLPQFVPAITQFTTTDVQETANNSIGGSFISLRGLGANRNLVLIDGKRAQPFNSQMFVDTNMIPASAIQRVELITGGASAVYGADAVGGVVNFILKDNFEGAAIETRYSGTEHGGGDETLISGLIGVNAANNRGNVMLGIERATRNKVETWQRDWRVEDMRNPATNPTAFFWGQDPWVTSTVPGFGPGGTNLDAFNAGNYPSQAAVDALFGPVAANGASRPAGYIPCTATPPGPSNGFGFFGNPASTCTIVNGRNAGVPNNANFFVDRATGNVYAGLMNAAGAAGTYAYSGAYNQDSFGNFQGLPYRVKQPDGQLKENNFWQWSSFPLERNSAFAKGHFDVSDNVKVTGQALFTRTHTQTSLGLGADNITFWGVPIPFSDAVYTGDPLRGIPSSLNADGSTNAEYRPGGRFGLNCPATGGCTQKQAWPVPPQITQLFQSRAPSAGFGNGAQAPLWLNAPPDWLRQAIGPRGGDITTSTSQLSLGAEGDFANHNQHWDVTFTTGYTDNITVQTGSVRLSQYRAIMASPNFGHGFIGDPNAYVTGFAESIATCATGLPSLTIFTPSADCVAAISPELKNQSQIKQSVFEANLTGDLAKWKAGTMSYALGADYRYDSYSFKPDNLSQNENFIDPIAGLFPNQNSGGNYDVKELYGELLIPIISKGPTLVEHFNVELGARMSDWSMEGVKTLDSYKALVDWGFTPKYRLRGGINKAHRAPNLSELFTERTQLFGGAPSVVGDQCAEANVLGPYSANAAISGAAQAAQTKKICQALMGALGSATFYAPGGGTTMTNGGTGIQNQLGNPDLTEEDADTLTIGLVANPLEKWTITVDYYTIEIKKMIALEGIDSVYGRCLAIANNPSGSPTAPGCLQIFRDPTNGNAANIDLPYTNKGRAKVEGVDLQLNWATMALGGGFNINSVMNYNLKSQTQDTPTSVTYDWAGTSGCALQIQCQGFTYRIFTTVNYFHGPWSLSLRHQYWPSIDPGPCATPLVTPTSCSNAIATGGGNGVSSTYQLFSLSGSYRFGDKYTLRVGIDNLLDKDPPLVNGNPLSQPYPIPATHFGTGFPPSTLAGTYDPLGRRGFVSFTMEF